MIETLYSKLADNLDDCERSDPRFSENGFYRLLAQERKKHLLLLQIKREYEMLEKEVMEDFEGTLKRRNRILRNIDKLIRDEVAGFILFDYSLDTEVPEQIFKAHYFLKRKLIPQLISIKMDLLIQGERYEECLNITEYILDIKKPVDNDDMQVDNVDLFDNPIIENETEGIHSLKTYLDKRSIAEIDRKLADVMLHNPEVV